MSEDAMVKVFPGLWFDGNAEEAASFCVSLLSEALGRSRCLDGAEVRYTAAYRPADPDTRTERRYLASA